MGLHKLLLVIFLYCIFDLNEALDALSIAQAAHILLHVSIAILILLEFQRFVIRQHPRKDEILIQVTVGPST